MNIIKERLITNHLMLDYLDMWDDFDIKSNSDKYVNQYYFGLLMLINDQINETISWLDSEEAKEFFMGETEYQLDVFNSLEEEWDEILEQSYDNVEGLLSEVYHRGKQKGYEDMREHIHYTQTDKLALDFARDYNFGLMDKIDDDVRYQIKNKIISGFLAGEHPYQIAPKILDIADEKLIGSNFSPKQRATMIARTEIARVQNTGILQSYVTEGYIQVKILTAEDDSVCYLCLKNAYEFNEDEPVTYDNHGDERVHYIGTLINNLNYVPLHPNCRCTYLSVWETKQNPKENPRIICLFENPKNPNDYLKVTSEHAGREYNRLKKDKSIKRISFVDDEIKFEGTPLKEGECFFKYEYENGVTIYKSIHGTTTSVQSIYNQYMSLPKEFRESATEIVLSSQDYHDGRFQVEGYVNPNNFNRIHILTDKNGSFSDLKSREILVHELAHCFEGADFKYSNGLFEDVFWDDYHEIENIAYNGKPLYQESQRFSTPYSFEFTNSAINGDENSYRRYSEDFAESVMMYFLYPDRLYERFENKYKYLNRIFHRYDN